jgi:hypothetical protein
MNFSTSILSQAFYFKNTEDYLTVNPSNNRIIDCHLESFDQNQIVSFIVGISERDKNAIIVDASAMASGKTQIAAGVTKEMLYESFVAIAHRISLIHGLSKTLNLTHYKDVTPQEYLKNLAVCVNSIKKLGVAERFKNAVFDEFRQTLETVLMAETIKNKKEILNEFKALLNNAEFSMCLDADFNDFCLDYLLENTNKNIYRIHRHVEPHNKQIIERKNHNSIRKECVQNYLNGLNSMVAVSSIAEAERCLKYFSECNINLNEILDITGDNKKDPRVKAFYLNPDEEIKNYRMLFYTPAITSGVSIVESYFDRHYIMMGKVLQSNENLQMVARDRTAQVIYCSFAKKTGKVLPTDINKLIHGSIKQRLRLELTKNNTVKSSEIQLDEIEVLQLKLQVQFNEDLNNFRESFFNHALANGYSVKSYDPSKDNTEDDVLQKGLNKRTLEHRIKVILNSEILDTVQADILSKASETTQAETNSLHRYKTTQMAGISEILDDDVKHYLKGAFKVVLRHESLNANQYTLIEKDRLNWQENGKFVSNSGLATIANEVIEFLGDKIIDKELARQACEILIKHSDELVANKFTNYAGKKIERPLRTLRNFLNKFGYTTQFLKQCGTVKRERVYTLVKISHIEQYVIQRQTQQNQAVSLTHINANYLSKENEIISVHSPEKYPPTDNWQKTDVKFSQIDNKFELIT